MAKRRELQLGALVLVVIGLPFLGVVINQWITEQRQQADPAFRQARFIKTRFRTIKPKDGKVLMAPGPSWNTTINSDLYTLSLAKNDYWKKPMLVGPGFRFGYLDGSREYEYKILDVDQRGMHIKYDESAMLTLILYVTWK